jgi:hypothetical protein
MQNGRKHAIYYKAGVTLEAVQKESESKKGASGQAHWHELAALKQSEE